MNEILKNFYRYIKFSKFITITFMLQRLKRILYIGMQIFEATNTKLMKIQGSLVKSNSIDAR